MVSASTWSWARQSELIFGRDDSGCGGGVGLDRRGLLRKEHRVLFFYLEVRLTSMVLRFTLIS